MGQVNCGLYENCEAPQRILYIVIRSRLLVTGNTMQFDDDASMSVIELCEQRNNKEAFRGQREDDFTDVQYEKS
jgi:hypothetical protein